MKTHAFPGVRLPLLAAAAVLSIAAQAGAATLNLTDGSFGGFGRAGGVYVTFSSSTISPTAAANWSAAPPQDGESYSVDSFSVIKNNGTGAGFSQLWVGVYTGYTEPDNSTTYGAFSGFLGASGPVAWSSFDTGSTVSWTFEGVNAAAAAGQTLYFAFQTSAGSLEGLPSIIAAEGDISIRRLPGDGNSITTAGAGILEPRLNEAIPTGTHGDLRTDRSPFLTIEITQVPEPSAALLSGLGVLGAWGARRRRNG